MSFISDQVYLKATHPLLEDVASQGLTNLLWACAKLRINPGEAELATFLRAIARPQMLEQTTSHGVANTLYAVGILSQEAGIQGVDERVWQRLLGDEQLDKVAKSSSGQHVATTMLGLARMAICQPPVSSTVFAQCAASKLVPHPTMGIDGWNAQDVANSMRACAKLGMQFDTHFHAVAVAGPSWLQDSNPVNITQVAWACKELGIANARLMQQLVNRSRHLLSKPGLYGPRKDGIGFVFFMAESLAALDMQNLARDVMGLITDKAVRVHLASKRFTPGHAGCLWGVHVWLQDKQLLDGKGLSDVLTPKQLALGKQASEQHKLARLHVAWHDGKDGNI